MGWVIGIVVLLAGGAVALGLARDASLARRIGRESPNREGGEDPGTR
jgi:hypothetical protein